MPYFFPPHIFIKISYYHFHLKLYCNIIFSK
nr:MAG TPA: hypothetical protein [Caudoviricetes sp.]